MRTSSPYRLTCIASVAALAAPLGAQPSFTGLGMLPGNSPTPQSDAWGVSADGSTVAGSSLIAGTPIFGPTYAAFRWTAQTGIQTIYSLGGIGTTCRAYAVNGNGSVVVGMADYGVLSPTQIVAFIWDQETGVREIGDLPGGPSGSDRAAARAVSADGAIVAGQGESDAGAEPFRYANSAFQGLGDLPGGAFGGSAYAISLDGVTIVGSSLTADGTEAFRWTAGEGMVSIGHLPVAAGISPFAEAYAADAYGDVIVGLSRSLASGNSGWEAFRWTPSGGMLGLGDFAGGAVLSAAYAVTADGSIIVGSGGIAGNCGPFGCQTAPRAFIWDAVSGMRDLRAFLVGRGLNLNGWVLTEARGISADGRVMVGTGTNPQGRIEAWRADLGRLCPADLDDGSGTGVRDGGVTIADLLYFLQLFVSGDTRADLDDGSGFGIRDGGVTIEDILYFLAHFAIGC